MRDDDPSRTPADLDEEESLSDPVAEEAETPGDLDEEEAKASVERAAPRAAVLHEAIRLEGEFELQRSHSALFWSAIAAGLSMGMSFLTQGLIEHYLPHATWVPLVSSFGYAVGFVIVVLGRQQLFTENTLTPVLALLESPDGEKLRRMLQLWAIVLVANLIGGVLFAGVVAETDVFHPEMRASFDTLALRAAAPDIWPQFIRGVFAGWLIALMVWLLPFSESSRIHTIVLMTWLIALGGFSHVIVGSIEVFYGCWRGILDWPDYLLRFLWPVLLGNVLGGIAIVAALNHGQVYSGAAHDS
ncbi:MAG TPA: formate/nitrite transporter family protein [Dehalococcoidia bacterium]|nr:formate/nitrite transporter family protein [Dehalococcoidia bacterium]